MAQNKRFKTAFYENVLKHFGLKTTNRKKRLAFSIAEAMITLLIVSLALAAAAPIMSRSIKNEVQVVNSGVPRGALMFFDRNTYGYPNNGCPNGWTNISEDEGASNRFLMLNVSSEAGNTADAFLPDHWHGVAAYQAANNADAWTIQRNFSVENPATQGYQYRWFPGDGGAGLLKAISDTAIATYFKKWGFGTTSYLYPASEEAVQAGTVHVHTNNFDVKPKSLSVIACRKN